MKIPAWNLTLPVSKSSQISVWLRFALALVLIASVATLSAAERASLKLLTIGNSFADNPLTYLPALAKDGGKTLVVGRANIGGCSLERHARHLAQAEANDPAGRAYKDAGKSVSLPEILASNQWEIVTIHQDSMDSFKFETYHPHVDKIIAAVHKYAPQAEIVIQETWAYREDHVFFKKNDGLNPPKMYEGIIGAYHKLAAETGFRIIPTGDAMNLARQTPHWASVPDKNFDFKNPPAGKLPSEPNNLFNAGSWKKNAAGESKFTLDAKHLNTAGKYLAGAVWYQTLFNTDTIPAGFVPPNLTAEDTADLRTHASAAVNAERAREDSKK